MPDIPPIVEIFKLDVDTADGHELFTVTYDNSTDESQLTRTSTPLDNDGEVT